MAALLVSSLAAVFAQGPWAERALKKFGADPANHHEICQLPDWDRDLMDHVAVAYKRLVGRSGNVKKYHYYFIVLLNSMWLTQQCTIRLL